MEEQVKILVVDDDNNLRETLADLLEIEGYRVYQAGNGKECIDLVSSEFFSVILMDYNLPDETGLDLIRKIRGFNQESQIVMITAYASLNSIMEAMKESVYDFLIKPVDFDYLKRTINRALDKYFLEQSNKELLAQLKTRNVELDRLNNMKSKFFSIVSHDLSNSLMTLKMSFDMLKRKMTPNEEQTKKMLKSSKKNVVSILGHSNRGKTYILQKLSDVNLDSGYQVQTKGLSIKIPEEKKILLLDTQGTNAPLLLEESEEDKRNDQNFREVLEYINLCQIITNYLIQTFIIKEANTLICVVGMLTSSETIFLNKVRKNCRNTKQLIVIHNLINCHTKRDIEKYKTETLLNNIIIKFEERVIPSFDISNKEDNFNKYYVEIDDDDKGHESDVLHFIFGNDNSKELKNFNESTINFIKNYIDIKVNKKTNIIEALTEHVNNLSSLVLKNKINIKVNEKLDLIKYEDQNEIEPKEIIADELDNITFIGNYYEPNYRYYKKDNKFIIGIDICSKLKEESLKALHCCDKDNKELEKFKITGERLICEKEEKKKIINNFINKRINAKKFKLEFKVDLSKEKINAISSEFNKEIKKGILFLSFEIIN